MVSKALELKNIKEIKFERVWGKSEEEKYFQTQ